MALPFYTDVDVHGNLNANGIKITSISPAVGMGIAVKGNIHCSGDIIATQGGTHQLMADNIVLDGDGAKISMSNDMVLETPFTKFTIGAEQTQLLRGRAQITIDNQDNNIIISTDPQGDGSVKVEGPRVVIESSSIGATGLTTLNGGLNVTNGGALVNGGLTVTGGGITANTIECSSFYREETKFNGLSSGANLDVQLTFSNNNTTATITVPAIKEEGLYYLVARLYTSAGRIIIDQVCWLEDSPVFEHHGRAAYINDYSPVWTDIHYYFWMSPDGLKIVIKSAGALNNSSISNPAQVEITKIFGTSLLPS